MSVTLSGQRIEQYYIEINLNSQSPETYIGNGFRHPKGPLEHNHFRAIQRCLDANVLGLSR